MLSQVTKKNFKSFLLIAFVCIGFWTNEYLEKLFPSKASLRHVTTEGLRIPYTWRLYDLYTPNEFALTENAGKRTVKKSFTLNFQSNPDENHFVQISPEPDFSSVKNYQVTGGTLHLHEVFPGANHYRISSDNQNWSQIKIFTAEPGCSSDPAPQVVVSKNQLILNAEETFAEIHFKSPNPVKGYVVQASRDPYFQSDVQSFWTAQQKMHLPFSAPGLYHYRFRAVNNALELTEWSVTQIFRVTLATQTAAR